MNYLIFLIIFINTLIANTELVIGEERVNPGIIFIFEGAIKDHIMPSNMHLSEEQTHVHIEARVNWDQNNIPNGTPILGFVPYLYINAIVKNQKTGIQTFIDLLPHINLVDNFHYARNMSLPGSIYDLYTVTFNVFPPTHMDLALHKDWVDDYGDKLLDNETFTYENIFFGDICESNRN
tara:strand:- start:229 stop:765 length:537 start_codon:yes stop_codon:yes gene_type:complete